MAKKELAIKLTDIINKNTGSTYNEFSKQESNKHFMKFTIKELRAAIKWHTGDYNVRIN